MQVTQNGYIMGLKKKSLGQTNRTGNLRIP